MYILFSGNNYKCGNVSVLCHDIANDYEVASNLISQFPKQILFLRYETLSFHPYKTLDVIYSFLNLSPKPIMDDYLASKTGIFRNLTKTNNFKYKTVSTANQCLTKVCFISESPYATYFY